jgi:hypothetical protein
MSNSKLKAENRFQYLLLRMGIILFLLIVLTLFGLFMKSAQAQAPSQTPPDRIIDVRFQQEVIDSISQALNEVYVFPEVAKEMEKYLRKQYQAKTYSGITSIAEFTERLEEDLRLVSHDSHLRVQYQPDEYFESTEDTLVDENLQEMYQEEAYDNFAFDKVERLPGNVGYLKMHAFNTIDWAGPTAMAAMNFIGHCDAIIIDLRQSLGGSPTMVQLLSSYFFAEPVHLNSFYIRKTDKTKQFWTYAYVREPRMEDVQIYILIGKRTVSAAEEFAYDLKHLKRATIVGETTKGAAHPSEWYEFPSLNIILSIPYGRSINPITDSNWEGVGAEPDIEASADKALDVAYMDALKSLQARCTDDAHKAELDWSITGLKAKLNPIILDKKILRDYVGIYAGERKISLLGNHLEYQRGKGPISLLIPMDEDLFSLEDLDFLRFKFVRDSSGNVIELIGLYRNGDRESHKKDK